MASVPKQHIGFFDCSDEEYFKSGALTSSAIKKIKDSPAHFKAYMDGLEKNTELQKENFDLGNFIHKGILENDISEYVALPEFKPVKAITKKSKEEAWLKENPEGDVKAQKFSPSPSITKIEQEEKFKKKHPGKRFVTEEQYENLHGMFDVFCDHPMAPKFINQCDKIEQPGFFKDEETGLWCGVKCDGFRSKKPIIFDYKTTRSTDPKTLMNSIFEYGYHISAAHYIAGIESLTGEKVEHYYLCFQEKSAPFDVVAIPLSEQLINHGEFVRRTLLRMIADCMDKDSWPGRAPGLMNLDIPDYLYQRDEVAVERLEEAAS